MKAALISTGFLVIGPNVTQFATAANLDEAITNLLAAENATRTVEQLLDRDDLLIREQFIKTWCGSIGDALSAEGVADTRTWDETYADQILEAAMRNPTVRSQLSITLDPNEPDPSAAVAKLLESLRAARAQVESGLNVAV